MDAKVKVFRSRLDKTQSRLVVLTIVGDDIYITDNTIQQVMWENEAAPVNNEDLDEIARLRESGRFKRKDLVAFGCLAKSPEDSNRFVCHHRFRADGTRDIVENGDRSLSSGLWHNGSNFVFQRAKHIS